MVSLPNLISLARLLCVPVVVWLILTGQMRAAFWVFVAAGFSDAADGFIARHFDARTAVGHYMDPLADKALLVSVYITLGLRGALFDWLVIMVVFRDLLIVGGALLFLTLSDDKIKLEPILISKLNTFLQIALATVVLAGLGFGIDTQNAPIYLTYATAATTVLSGAGYIMRWVRGTAAVERV
ncbi:MAG: CDP-alcohol phosphatidyltransferase family protein [Alphaproteobacteria bacterium]